jgi:hypothetical protein
MGQCLLLLNKVRSVRAIAETGSLQALTETEFRSTKSGQDNLVNSLKQIAR